MKDNFKSVEKLRSQCIALYLVFKIFLLKLTSTRCVGEIMKDLLSKSIMFYLYIFLKG